MQIEQQKTSMNGSVGVRICKVQNGDKVYFDQFLSNFNFCQLTVDNNSDTSSSSDDEGKPDSSSYFFSLLLEF